MLLEPIKMYPAYRHGAQTPWGGSRLREVFHKNIPDDHTGESLELSAIPNLNSVTEEGVGLEELLSKYGEALVGTKVQGPFPLLLKLLDARDRLSVQVHPGDAYAARVENKQGKTEAWVILDCDEGAELVFGVREGVTKEELKRASMAGKAVEPLLGRVRVKPGDVYYIPAGTVHAIGAGILIYEIQQSSDVTYRFYDWGRTDSKGNKRELHIEKALDVVDLSIRQEKTVPVQIAEGREQLLRETYFSLQRWKKTEAQLKADERCFKILTALGETLLQWEGGQMTLPAGQTVLLPAKGYDLNIRTEEALIAYPTV